MNFGQALVARIQHINVFLLPAMLGGGLLVFRHLVQKRPGEFVGFRRWFNRERQKRALIFTVCCLAMAFMFEMYYQIGQCSNSARYNAENFRAVSRSFTKLTQAGFPVWLEFGTLLTLMRGKPIVPWDQDSDVGVLLSSREDILRVYEALQGVGYEAIPDLWSPEQCTQLSDCLDQKHWYRDLFQVVPAGSSPRFAAHTDIWLFFPDMEASGRELVVLHDPYTCHYPRRRRRDILPLQDTTWQGRNWTIPNDADYILVREIGEDWHIPKFFRKDCFHNFFNLRFMW